MPSLRPQHRRGNGAVGVTLMRSANQFNNARRRGTYAPHAGGVGNGHVSREGRRNNRSIVRVSGDSSKLHGMNPRKRRAASHKASRMRCAGTPRPASPLAPPATPKRNTQEWQDSRVVHDSRGLCSKKGSFLARYSRDASSDGDLQGFSDTWRANLATDCRLRTHRGVTEPGDATRTKHQPIQHRMLTRPRNHENILVPSAKKRR